jgi:hypothetical protein
MRLVLVCYADFVRGYVYYCGRADRDVFKRYVGNFCFELSFAGDDSQYEIV